MNNIWETFCLENHLVKSYGSMDWKIFGLCSTKEFSYSSFSIRSLLQPKNKFGLSLTLHTLNLEFWPRRAQVEENCSWRASKLTLWKKTTKLHLFNHWICLMRKAINFQFKMRQKERIKFNFLKRMSTIFKNHLLSLFKKQKSKKPLPRKESNAKMFVNSCLRNSKIAELSSQWLSN